jgi:hypothetical protein
MRFFTLASLRFATVVAVLFASPRLNATEKFAYSDVQRDDFFPILPWDRLHGPDGKASDSKVNGLESIAESHFNFAGFVLPEDLASCRKLNLAAILLLADPQLLPLRYHKEWRLLSDQEIDNQVKVLVEAGGSNPALKGYFLMDEPSARDFPALAKAVAAVKRHAPNKLAYINLLPDYATLGAPDTSQLGTSTYPEYLERFVTEVHPQLLSYDNYMVQYSDDLKDSKVAESYFRNLAEVRRVGQKYKLPCLQIVASNQLRPNHTVPSPANLMMQAYTTLAAGFRGVTWYTYFGRRYGHAPIDASGNKTITWEYLREVNRQVAVLAPVLSKLASTGIFFTEPAPAEGLPSLPGASVESIKSNAPMMVGEFSGKQGETYFMLVNLSLERSAHFQIRTKSADAKLQKVSSVDGGLGAFNPGKDGFWLTAGQGVLVKVGK